MYNKRGVVAVANSTTEIMATVFEDICREVIDPYFEGQRTSGVEGNHSQNPESGHYYGRSEDYGFEGRHVLHKGPIVIPKEKRHAIANNCQHRLDSMWGKNMFLVILEDTHFHFQRGKNSF